MKSMQLFLFALLTAVAIASSAQDSYLPHSWRHDTPQSNADIIKSYFDRMATKTTTSTTTTTTAAVAAALRLPNMHHVRRHHHEKLDESKPPVKVEKPHRRFANEVEHFAKAKASDLQVDLTHLPPGWQDAERPHSNAEILKDYFARMATKTSTTTTTTSTTKTVQKPPKMHRVRLHRRVAKKDAPPAPTKAPHANFVKEFEKFVKAHASPARSTEGHRHDSTSTTTTTSTTTSHQGYQLPHGHPLRVVPRRNSVN